MTASDESAVLQLLLVVATPSLFAAVLELSVPTLAGHLVQLNQICMATAAPT
jgi:hypothetical protein